MPNQDRVQKQRESQLAREYEDYDPHDHRDMAEGTTYGQTLTLIIKGSLGTGVLAVADGFLNGGLVFSAVGTILFGFLCTYAFLTLIKTQYVLCKRNRVPFLNYPDSIKMALKEGPFWMRGFAGPSVYLVDIFLVVFQMGTCCVYIVFVAENIKQVCDVHSMVLDKRIHMCILILPFMLIFCIPDLKYLTPFTQAANVVTFVALGMLMPYLFTDLPNIKEREKIADVSKIPLFVGTILFCLESVPCMLTLESNMKNPKEFLGVTGSYSIGMIIIVLMLALLGFVGYWRYGKETKASLTLNIPPDEIYAQFIKILFCIQIYISYALQGFSAVIILWEYFFQRRFGEENRVLVEYILRFVIIIVTFGVAVGLPLLGLFISLFGALCASMLGIVFPPLMELCVLYPENYGKYQIYLAKDVALILFGIFIMLSGTYMGIKGIAICMYTNECD